MTINYSCLQLNGYLEKTGTILTRKKMKRDNDSDFMKILQRRLPSSTVLSTEERGKLGGTEKIEIHNNIVSPN